MKFPNIIFRVLLYAVIIIVVFAISRCLCQTPDTAITYRFVNPALRGMVSNYDLGALQPTEALYLLNGRVTETMGRLKRRPGLADYGVNTTKLYGACGYYNPLSGHKLVIGVTDHATSGLGQFVVSDMFGTEVGYDTLEGTIFPYADVCHDFTPYKDMVICADGKSIPCIFTTSQGFLYTLSKPDTFGYDPHLVSMGLEAPGQPRVGLVNVGDTGELNDRYIYAFAYFYDSVLGIESRPITAENEHIYITNFPQDTTVALLRKKGQEDNLWYLMDTTTDTTGGYYYIDSIPDTAQAIRVLWWKDASNDTLFDTLPSTDLGYYYNVVPWTYYQCCNEPEGWDSVGYRRTIHNGSPESCGPESYGCGVISLGYTVDPDSVSTDIDSFTVDTAGSQVFTSKTSGRTPGQFVYIDRGAVIDTVGYVDSLAMSSPDSLYWIAYSYYDQVTGIESPLGPILACSLTEISGDSVFSRLFAFDNFDTTLNPSLIRVYQTLTKTTLAGASDTMVWRGILQIRAFDGAVVLGNWNDDSVNVGLDTAYINTQQYYTHQMYSTIMPPYNYDCRVPFSDVEYIGGQLWGIGDPDYPNRVYYSMYYNLFSWYPLDFVQVNELGNDEFVKIERAEGFGDDALYLFAHNSVWLMDEQGNYQAISTRVGAASQEVVVKHGEIVSFISPDLRIYALSGTQLTEISGGIENRVESVFVNYDVLSNYRGFFAWGHTMGDYVRWFNDSTGMGISFNTKSGVWSLERYGSGNYVPRGSISYDTTHSSGLSVIMASNIELLYMDSAVSLRKEDVTAEYDVAGIYLERAIQFAFETPNLGDHVYNQQIQQVDLTLEMYATGGAFHYTVYDEYRNSLCDDSVSLAYSDTIVRLRIALPYNNSFLPSLRIYTNDTDSLWSGGGDPHWVFYYHNFDIIDMSVKVIPMGMGHVQ